MKLMKGPLTPRRGISCEGHKRTMLHQNVESEYLFEGPVPVGDNPRMLTHVYVIHLHIFYTHYNSVIEFHV